MTHPSLVIKHTHTGTIAIKTVSQSVKGTAYMKIPGLLIDIWNHGHNFITLRINNNHPYIPQVRLKVQFLQRTIPGLRMEFY